MLAVAIAFLGACIAWGQWHVARQKLVLDLFDKRYVRYHDFRSAFGELMNKGHLNTQAWLQFTSAANEMEYLFGKDVRALLEEAKEVGVAIRKHERALDSAHLERGPERDKIAELLETKTNRHDKLMSELYDLLMPYLRMEQRLPVPVTEWPRVLSERLADKWKSRPTGEA